MSPKTSRSPRREMSLSLLFAEMILHAAGSVRLIYFLKIVILGVMGSKAGFLWDRLTSGSGGWGEQAKTN